MRPFVRVPSFALVILVLPAAAGSTPLTFEGPLAGTVVAGESPGGAIAPGTLFPGVTISAVNAGEGPDAAMIFDSAHPSGGDDDLGTPNDTCDDGVTNGSLPGVGEGGEVGMPGENCIPYGNVLVIAEDIVDVAPLDGLVDDPDDEAAGGTIRLVFDDVVVVRHVVLLDIDAGGTTVEIDSEGNLRISATAANLGDNSAQTISLESFGGIEALEVVFTTSGAIAEIDYGVAAVPTREASWGAIKHRFR
jgi:hypothetical protein